MSLHELFTRSSRGRARRLRLARRGRGLPGLPRRWPRGSARATPHDLRRLAAIDRVLTVETPGLASMFAMFNELASGAPVGAERLPARAGPRLRLAQVAVLAALAAIVALSVVLSTQLHSVIRPCLTASSSTASPSGQSTASPSGQSTTASTALSTPASPSTPTSSGAGRAGGPAAFAPLRNLSCQAYSANK